MTETKMLPVMLNETEQHERSQEMSTKFIELVDMKATHASRKKAMADAEKALDYELSNLARIVKQGKELRPVECRIVPNVERSTMDTVRLDTGEVVESRPMTRTEYEEAMQVPLFQDTADVRNN